MNGIELLDAYMSGKRLTQAEMADRVGVPSAMVSMWLSGRRRPGLRHAFGIEAATGGAVPAKAWLISKAHKRSLARRTA